ncbi:MAG: hypothetical protein C0505_01800 [Leptothrix sp. (in: Bacteria)]|nr:hypothetical protein [Leptothrix sp. (in: b-proteobacteria)]
MSDRATPAMQAAPAAPAAAPPGGPAAAAERTEELRLALVLNGGVSLAVWMGGVAFELNRLVRETHPVYRGLLELTGTAARIDVISGTSAGGINGAALALAQIHDRSLYALRDVWLDTAGLERLLRDPDEKEPASMLRGDDWFLPRIRDALAGLAQGERAAPDAVPVLLSLTSTLLDGQGHRRLDDFGEVVEDTVHRALWRFDRQGDGDTDAFADPQIVDQLAFAARATASFPVAFEPALYDAKAAPFKDAQAPRLRVRLPKEVAGEPGTPGEPDLRYLLDGGILDNKPFEAALEGIARLPAQGNTRRVLAYVVPDPAAAAAPRERDEHRKLVAPTMAQVAWRSLVGIPGSQSIASHMAELREHNDRAARRWRRIVGAMQHVQAAAMLAQAGTLLPAYRARRVDGVIDYLLDETEAALAQGGTVGPGHDGMRRATRQWLASTWRASSQREPALWANQRFTADEQRQLDGLRRQWASRVPRRFEPRAPLLGAAQWQWGLYALEFVADLTAELLRRTQRLHALVGRWTQADGAVVSGPAMGATPPPRSDDWLVLDRADSPARLARQARGQRVGDDSLQPKWQQAYTLAGRLRGRRRLADASAGRVGRAGFAALIAAWRREGGERPSRALALGLLADLLGADEAIETQVQGDNEADARALFKLLAELEPTMAAILAAHRRPTGRADVEEALVEMRAIHAYLFTPLPDHDAADPLDRLAWRVLALEVFEVSAGSRRMGPGARAEVMQISARLKSALGGGSDPALKLNGMQLAHFGAFYKRSWRANDWTFGCLDGIDRAVRIALNADAMQRRYGLRQVECGDGRGPQSAATYVRACLRSLAVDGAEIEIRPYLQRLWDADEPAITRELAWLDQASTVPPPVLEHSATALTRRLQLEALRRELPEIATSLIAERDSGAPPSAQAGVPLLARVAPAGKPAAPAPEDVQALIENNLLGGESLAQQVGTDLFTRTSSHGLATAHAALSSRHGGLNALNVLFKLTEWPLRLLYWMANRLSHASGTAAALEGAALGIGGALVAAGLLVEKLPGAALGLGWALLAGVFGATLLRSARLGALLLALLLGGLWLLDKIAFAQLAAACVALWLLMQPWGGTLAMLGIVLAAVWWSAGGTGEALALLWRQIDPWAGAPPLGVPPPRPADLEAAARLKLALWPALLVLALVMLNAFSRQLVDRLRRASMRRLRKAQEVLQAARERAHRRAGGPPR